MSSAAFAGQAIVCAIGALYAVMAVVIAYNETKRSVHGWWSRRVIHARNRRLGLTAFPVDLHHQKNLLVYNVRAIRTGEHPIADDYNDYAEEGYSGSAA